MAWVCLLAGASAGATVACGDDEGGGGSGGSAPQGTRSRFDLAADLTADFYALPYPSDLRLTAEGTPDVAAIPRSDKPVVDTLILAATDRPGFPALPVAFFTFDAAIAPRDPADVISGISGDILLVDVDPDSPDRGALFPVTAKTLLADDFVPDHMLSVAAHPGVSLPPGRRYALVVRTALGDAEGEPLAQPPALAALAEGETPEAALGAEAAALHAPLWETLDELGVAASDVAAATVFTVGDVAQHTHDVSQILVEKYDLTIDDIALDTDGATHARYCELTGTIAQPQFNVGTPPYDTDGHFVMGSDGAPEEQTTDVVPVTLTIPKSEMPAAGYPLMLYIHGSGGKASQVVDRGPVTVPDGGEADWAVGLGPAHVVAEHGIAAAGAAMPLNPERVPSAGDYDYINTANPRSFGYVFRQGVFEQRLLIEALGRVSIDPSVLAACAGPTLPGGTTAYKYDLDRFVLMGQSMGGQYANLVAAVEPKVLGVVPTGAGGFWGQFLQVSPLFGGVNIIAGTLFGIDRAEISHHHPGVHLLQTAWEYGEPISYVPRIAQRPLAGHPTRSIYAPVGNGDEYFPTVLFDAMAIASGNQQAGDEVWSGMQTTMAVLGSDGLADYPVSGNRTGGDPFTGVVVQYEPDGLLNAHYIFQQLDEVKYQYGCFFSSLLETGVATVPAPAALGTPCP